MTSGENKETKMQIAKLNIEAGLAIEEEFGGESFEMTEQAVYVNADDDDVDVETLTAETTRRNGRDFQIEETRQNALLTELAGDDEYLAEIAFTELFKHYEDKLLSLAKLWTNDHHDSEDIVMEVFNAVWQTRQKITANARFWMLLKKMTMNKIRNRHRNLKKRQTEAWDMTDADKVHSAAVEPTSPKAGPEKQAEMNEVMAAVNDALDRLKPNEKAAVLMQSEGIKGKDIAKELGLKPNRVKSLVRNAKIKVEKDLYDRYPELFGKPDNAE